MDSDKSYTDNYLTGMISFNSIAFLCSETIFLCSIFFNNREMTSLEEFNSSAIC